MGAGGGGGSPAPPRPAPLNESPGGRRPASTRHTPPTAPLPAPVPIPAPRGSAARPLAPPGLELLRRAPPPAGCGGEQRPVSLRGRPPPPCPLPLASPRTPVSVLPKTPLVCYSQRSSGLRQAGRGCETEQQPPGRAERRSRRPGRAGLGRLGGCSAPRTGGQGRKAAGSPPARPHRFPPGSSAKPSPPAQPQQRAAAAAAPRTRRGKRFSRRPAAKAPSAQP